jgi:hypothetical protein
VCATITLALLSLPSLSRLCADWKRVRLSIRSTKFAWMVWRNGTAAAPGSLLTLPPPSLSWHSLRNHHSKGDKDSHRKRLEDPQSGRRETGARFSAHGTIGASLIFVPPSISAQVPRGGQRDDRLSPPPSLSSLTAMTEERWRQQNLLINNKSHLSLGSCLRRSRQDGTEASHEIVHLGPAQRRDRLY